MMWKKFPALATGMLALFLAAPSFAAPPVGWPGPQILQGEPAVTGSQPVQATLTATPVGDPQDVDLRFSLTDPKTHKPITDYQETHTKAMHVIVVDDSFHDFIHEHVGKIPSGIAGVKVRLATTSGYWVFAEFQPRGYGHQVIRFHLPPTGPEILKPLGKGNLSVEVKPYRVTINQAILPAGQASSLTVHIDKDGRPASDLRPWLGAPAHIVIIGTSTRDFIHAHPMLAGQAHKEHSATMGEMDMSKMDTHADKAGPDLNVSVTLPTKQTYAMWVQFTGSNPSNVYTAPFVLQGN